MHPLARLLAALGDDVEDAEEEAFVLASQQLPSHNLGFLDSKAKTLDLTVAGKDASIRQSPGLLESNRKEGTTGAVVWRITPLFADWLSNPANILTQCGVLAPSANVLELGCGISGLVSLALAGRVAKYVNTDQEYVLKLARENVGNNYEVFCGAGKGGSARKKGAGRRDVGARKPVSAGEDQIGNVLIRGLDWETSSMEHLYKDVGVDHLDLLVSCDCIYNEALVEPLATTMREICKLATDTDTPTICVVAQQLRSPDVLEAWLKSFCSYFKVWRIPDELLDAGLREGSGYVVHVGVVR